MMKRRKGFTLVEVIVVLVILAILAAILVPAMTGWIDKANEKRLIVACRTCVTAAQTLATEAYGTSKSKTPPESTAVIALADVPGTVSSISLDAASVLVNTLTYSEGAESVTYMRQPSPQYVSGTGIAAEIAAASNWAQQYVKPDTSEKNEQLTIKFGKQNTSVLTKAQLDSIFGELEPVHETQFICPMAIYDNSGHLMNIQYVTPHNPYESSGHNRYQASAFIIDGKTYVSKIRTAGKVNIALSAKAGEDAYYFQPLMNAPNSPFTSTQDFVDFITTNGGQFELAE